MSASSVAVAGGRVDHVRGSFLSEQPPPPVLTGLYVVAHVHVDDSIVFEQRRTLSVDGQWLGRVPAVAICQDFETREYSIQYCAADWEPWAISGSHTSLDEAKAKVERSYHGLADRWISATTTFEAALALHEAELREGACSFCGRTPMQVSMMFGEGTRICGDCVIRFHHSLHEGDTGP
jgi:hypothetical protein